MASKYGVAGDQDPSSKDDAPVATSVSVQILTPPASSLRQDVKEAIVLENFDITVPVPNFPRKRHMTVKLPSDVSYDAGEYIAVLPLNPKVSIAQAMERFGLPFDAHIIIESSRLSTLPTGVAVRAYDVLEAYVELSQPATKRVKKRAPFAAPPSHRVEGH